MKNNHGKLFFLLLFTLTTLLNAEQSKYCSYKITSSKTDNIVLYEPISISFYTRQKVHNEMMFFDLKAQKSKDYDIVSINEKRHEYNYHDAEKNFEFLLIPKKMGNINVIFDFIIRRASDDAVAQAYVGSRDNVKSIPSIKVHIAQPSVTLNVKALQKKVDAVGDFTLSMKLEKKESNSYDAVNVVYTLQGKGYLNPRYKPLNSIKDISIFKGEKETPPRVSAKGYIYYKEWSYALIAQKSFFLPSAKLSSYDYIQQQYRLLQTSQEKITITPLDIKTLLDEKELPSKINNYKQYINYFYNFLLFLGGFIFAKILDLLPKRSIKKEQCCVDIKKSKNAQELLSHSLKFTREANLEEEIANLENIIYKHTSSKDFNQIKIKIIQKIERLS